MTSEAILIFLFFLTLSILVFALFMVYEKLTEAQGEIERLKNRSKVLEVRTDINRDKIQLVETGLDILFSAVRSDANQEVVQ